MGGAFRGGARWLIVPAFVLALPLGVVSAADLKLDGDWGDRTFRPVESGAVAHGYKMGVGHMQVDLRGTPTPARPDGHAGQARRGPARDRRAPRRVRHL